MERRRPVSLRRATSLHTAAYDSARATIPAADGVHLVSQANDPPRALGAVDSDGASCRLHTASPAHAFAFGVQCHGERHAEEV